MQRRVLAFVPLLALLALGCPGGPQPITPVGNGHGSGSAVASRPTLAGPGFHLSDANDDGQGKNAPPAKTTPLSAAETQAVLARLPALPGEPGDSKEFALRGKTLPAPKTGKTVQEPFPPPNPGGAPPAVNANPLTVARHAPDGAVDLAPYVSLTFSEPMVAITSHDDLAKTPPPVKLTPMPPGTFRWVGTQTVLFEPKEEAKNVAGDSVQERTRLPMATEYTIEVPAGTRAAGGHTLAQAARYTFKTPPPKVGSTFPSSSTPVKLDPIEFMSFDQKIDRGSMLASVELKDSDGNVTPIRLATDEEVRADKTIAQMARTARADRFLAVRAVSRLRPDTAYTMTVKRGAPSAEGPLRTDHDQGFSFHTFGPLKVVDHRCGWQNDCPPFSPLQIELSNPLATSFDKKLLAVEPAIPSMKVSHYGSHVEIYGRTKGRTTYRVTVKSATTDVFDQTLGKDETVSFDVGPAKPALFPEERPMVVLDPSGSTSVPVFTINEPDVRVRLYAVTPDDWPAYIAWRKAWDYERKTTTPPGRQVMNKIVPTHGKSEELTTTDVALDPALTQKLGQVLLIVEPSHAPPKDVMQTMYRTWVQVTKIGVEAMVDADEVLAWTTDLATGAPMSGVALAFGGGGGQRGGATSGADGLGHLPLNDADGTFVVAKKGGDVALLTEGVWGSNLKRAVRTDQVRWFVFDDRGTYKPKEEAHLKGWIRRIGMSKGGDVGKLAGAVKAAYRVRDARGNEYAKGDATIDAGGGFELSFKIPDNVNLGPSMVTFTLDGVSGVNQTSTVHSISVQEFRRPEFEVSASAGAGPYLVQEHGVATVDAKYYAGGGLPNADVVWNVTRSDGSFTPPNQQDYTFGRPLDPWMGWFSVRHGKPGEEEDRTATWQAKTDSEGSHRLRVDFDGTGDGFPMSLNFQASVTDVNRQSWGAGTTMLVHPASAYVGVKPTKNFVRAGDPIALDLIVVDIDGHAVPQRHVTVESARLEVEQDGDEYVEKEHDGATCAVDSTAGASRCSLATKEPGRYRVRATVTDDKGRISRTELYTWVTGDEIPLGHGLPEGAVQIVLDKKEYKVGDTAEILMMAPFGPSEGILTVGRQGMVATQRVSLRGSSGTVSVKIDPSWVPNAFVRVDLVGAAPREGSDGTPDPKLPKRPGHANGVATLVIPPVDRTLALHVAPAASKVEPGARTEIDVEVKDASGRPVAGSDVALVVADEAILALSAYKLADPLAVFYAARSEDVRNLSLRSDVLLADPNKLTITGAPGRSRVQIQADEVMIQGGYGGAPPPPMAAPMAPAQSASAPAMKAMDMRAEVSGADAAPTTPISVRQDFNPIAAFVPHVVTDARGHAKVPVKLPDNLTRYRIMAVAISGERDFGSSESTLTARLPLMVRPSAPRFLNFGDAFELPVVLQNQTDQPLQVDVAARASNATIEARGKRVTVPANDRVEVRLASAASKPGTARFQIGAASGRFADAAKIELPVWTPATTEAFATYGQVDEGAVAQHVKAPSAVVRDFGGLEISTSSTALSALTDAIIYLVRYPFECNEQLASRILGVVSLKDVLAAFQAKDLPPPAELTASVDKDIARLKARQRYDGGWGFWAGSVEDWPYLSIHVAHALARAKEKGFNVPQEMITRADGYLRNIEQHIPSYYGIEERRSLIAYALFTRHLLADTDRVRARALVNEAGDKLPIEADGWVLRVLTSDPGSAKEVATIRRALANRVTETAGAAHFTTHYSDGAHLLLSSDRRADGVILESLIYDQPQSDVIPKVVAGLLAHRTAGRWENTNESAFVLLALDKYFRTYEKATPAFVARAWLGDKFAGEHSFQGRTTDQARIDVPMAIVQDEASRQTDLVIQKDGAGRLYYRIGMQYAPSDLRPPPADHGFTVSRVYEAVDDPSDVKRDGDGTWHVKAGAKVRVRVAMVVPDRRYHVALVDPLPAGFEAMNADLAVTGAIPADPNGAKSGRAWWWGTWYEHQNLRDERVEAFASLVWDGVYDYTYVARATTPGSFVVPPPKAEEMYAPETFGRGSGDKVVIE